MKLNHRYLVIPVWNGPIFELVVIEVTKLHYKLKYDSGHIEWVPKKTVHDNWEIAESLGELNKKPIYDEPKE